MEKNYTALKTLFVSVWLIPLLFAAYCVQAAEQVYLYTYHNKPPFVTNASNQQGPYFDLANALNARVDDYQFTTVVVPRKRLDRMIASGELNGAVLGATPLWFDDTHEQRFLWLPPFFPDRDDFISLKLTPFEYTNDTSLHGKTIGAVSGYYYFGINEAVQKGQTLRIDTVGEAQVLQLVALQLADIGLVSQSVFNYLRRHQVIGDEFHLSKVPHDQFIRQAFLPRHRVTLHQVMTQLINDMLQDGTMQTLLDEYR